jgi:adenylylsulfate reductase, subunit A
MIQEMLEPLQVFSANKDTTTDPDINPNYLRPKQFMSRLQKIMDEYAGGVSTQLATSQHQLEKGLELLGLLREDSRKLGAETLHELMRCWENRHRLLQAEAHMRSVLYREETRWPGYYVRSDKPALDQRNWLAFCNTKYEPSTGEWTMVKRPVKYLTTDSER